nr:TonB-dependent receptor [Fibrobacterota bacterium]
KARGSKVHRDKEVSRIRLSRQDLQRVAAAQGDPLKVLGTLPGVTNQNDLSVRPFVRGGKAEETQILWDGVPLLQPYHFGTIYSIFNTESIESMTLYSGGFPVEAGNALSAALFLESRPAPLDSLKLFTDLSLLRGSTYAGVPIVKNRLSVSFSWQAFWYDWVVNRAWDIADITQNDSSFSAQKQDFRRYLELPNFRDFQMGLNWRMNDRIKGDYVGLISRDGFHSRNSATHYYHNGREVSPRWFSDNRIPEDPDNIWVQRQDLDTIANVAVDNQVHGIHFHWRPNEAWDVNQNFAYQQQEWHVKFSDEVTWRDSVAPSGRYAGYKTYGPSVRLLKLEKQAFDWNLNAKWQASRNHLAKMGLFQSIRSFDFETKLERTIYEVIVNGSIDATDGLGYLHPSGLVIRESDPGAGGNADYLAALPDLVRFDYGGRHSGSFLGGYLSDSWSIDDTHRLTVGVRTELDTWSGDAFVSPRIAYFQSLGDKDEITLGTGLYSQSDFPFNMRDVNPELRPEKAFHANAEWSHHFSKHYRMELSVYQKNYYDLAVPVIRSTGRIDFSKRGLIEFDSAQFEMLDPAIKAFLIERFGEKRMEYVNQGVGKAAGGEVSFFYDPARFWSGWVSAEAGYSKRRDLPGERVYDFRYHRPWAFNWVNYFHMPSNYELSLRGRFAAGLPYTDYQTPGLPGATVGGDTLFYLGPRNHERYSPYSRWDIRLSKETKLFGHPFSSYMEIWNAFNTPNFIMRDQKTEQWKFFDANYPIPILFMGANYRW